MQIEITEGAMDTDVEAARTIDDEMKAGLIAGTASSAMSVRRTRSGSELPSLKVCCRVPLLPGMTRNNLANVHTAKVRTGCCRYQSGTAAFQARIAS
ncbi:hypothetical protein P3W85_16550 [Cupriavidus basilensis]|uniref:Uncharacterized protein n=1 Tax=Cupriavidus basilensis TaxID=68895 RepID=A0ABT6APJ9_9BURK|nr:hypothetical protein [Cupriavidus basilensis]MDF3834554.1 hypothetical protein [Cupriavidus basilensis]